MIPSAWGLQPREDRAALIAQKQRVRTQIEQVQRQLEQARTQNNRRKIAQLEAQLEHWQAQEYQLRVAIDQSR